MSNTAAHSDADYTNFLVGTNTAGNREVFQVPDGASYDLDAEDIVNLYSADSVAFPYPAS